ncbi:MAG: DUF2232 domain-containing protein [bacterium]|nr:DUF2232 domain-containing protein [bacterium]
MINKLSVRKISNFIFLSFFLFWLGLYFPLLIFCAVWGIILALQDKTLSVFEKVFVVIVPLLAIKFLLNDILALTFLMLIVVLSIIIAGGGKNKLSTKKIFLFSFGYLLFLFGLLFIIFYYVRSESFLVYFMERIEGVFNEKVFPYLISDKQETFKDGLVFLKEYFYALIVVFTGFSLLISFKFGERYTKRKFFINRHWRINEYFIFIFIIALFFILLNKTPLVLFNKNILFIVGSLYFLQGLLILRSVITRLKLHRIFGLLLIIFAFLQPIVIMFLGLIDVWYDFRKRMKRRKD